MFQCAQLHSKETLDWPMAALHMKEELKCVMMDSGVQCVMTAGVEMMLVLLASSLDSLHGVRYYHNNVIIIIAIIMIILCCHIAQNFRWIKISLNAHTLY